MVDDPAARMRRMRAHRRSDHSLCRPERCEAAAAAVEPGGNGHGGPLSEAVRAAGLLAGDVVRRELLATLAGQAEVGSVSAARALSSELRALVAEQSTGEVLAADALPPAEWQHCLSCRAPLTPAERWGEGWQEYPGAVRAAADAGYEP